MPDRFSDRHGYRPPTAAITVRDDAPPELRSAILLIAEDAGMLPSVMRRVICRVLLTQPDPYNWSEYPNIREEVDRIIEDVPWSKVYDIAEALWAQLSVNQSRNSQPADQFEQRLNGFFSENGIGWELRDGQVIHRGSEAFEKSTHEVPKRLEESGLQRAANEMREALADISRRPEPDTTGAMQHAMGALEATAREVTGQSKPTLGKLVPRLDLPEPLDQAVTKLWGYASERARHIREHQVVDHAEAELVVSLAGSLCAFLLQSRS